MKKLLLTSSGLDNEFIRERFLELAGEPAEKLRVLFVTAPHRKEKTREQVLLCREDLQNAGIQEKNIVEFAFDHKLANDEISEFQAVYVYGRNPAHLLSGMRKCCFDGILKNFWKRDGVYVGVSAGSLIMTASMEEGYSFVNCRLAIHADFGSPRGPLNTRACPLVEITSHQALLQLENQAFILE